ncbi:hypothetical protein CDAR_321211 [Caerostris darwini]|uniref:Sodium/potassium-transporting ATPase subunit beta n=1 Tax=Caerostris darwini TaxID=1538125 RepID=A0AAV4TCU8_9ARAC|nr:hypothetical protein CDAR_321211 [Caerostris darwini]
MDPDADVEDVPLKGNVTNMEIDSTALSGENSSSANKGARQWLTGPRRKWLIAILVAIILLTVIVVSTLLALKGDYDSTRLVKIWPRPDKAQNLIYFMHGADGSWRQLTKQLDEFFIPYQSYAYRSEDVIICGDKNQDMNKVCYFDIQPFMQGCSHANNYGYDIGMPCVFLEFNNISGWVPEPYSPEELQKYVKLTDDPSSFTDLVYLDCQGDSFADQENVGPIEYTPVHGFPTKYFPYRGHPDYMSPLVGVRFTRPITGVAITVTCKLWAKNIQHTEGAVPNGQITFNLLVD